MKAWREVGLGLVSNLNLKGKRGEKMGFSPLFFLAKPAVGVSRERGEKLLLLYNLRRSGGRNPSSKDLKFICSTRAMRGYRQHAVSPKISVWRRKSSERSSTFSLRFTAIGGSVLVSQDLKSEYSSRATRGLQNKEFLSKIRAEVQEGRGSRVFGTPKSFVFAPRGREPSYSGLYFI